MPSEIFRKKSRWKTIRVSSQIKNVNQFNIYHDFFLDICMDMHLDIYLRYPQSYPKIPTKDMMVFEYFWSSLQKHDIYPC